MKHYQQQLTKYSFSLKHLHSAVIGSPDVSGIVCESGEIILTAIIKLLYQVIKIKGHNILVAF